MEFIKKYTELKAAVKALLEAVKGLHEIDRESWLYQYSVNFILDGIKYGIKNVGSKPEIIRMVERKWIIFKRRLQGKDDFGD